MKSVLQKIMEWIPFEIAGELCQSDAAETEKRDKVQSADLGVLSDAADRGRVFGYSRELEVRVRSERTGTYGCWETIYVRSAEFRRASGHIVFLTNVRHEVDERINSSTPRERRSEALYGVSVEILLDGNILSSSTDRVRVITDEMGGLPNPHDVNWVGVAIEVSKHVVAIGAER